MYYSDEIIEEVRSRNDIVDVISGYVKLQRKGSSYFGLCPFHNEKSPSFSVSPGKQMYYCFGCGAGGNVFTFLMEYENFTFVEAVKHLADRAGVKLPEAEYSKEARQAADLRSRLLEVQKKAAAFYYYQLRQESGQQAMEYLTGRELSEETMRKFGLGYSPKFSGGLYRYLKEKGYSDSLLKESGLFNIDERRGMQDKFWNRVMFPIMDVNNRVIGFGGRVMGDAKPKYLNSPETKIFDKSRNLYGLNAARTSRKPYLIICEGYMDVISMHQAGFTNAVASLGTALTSGHASLMSRYTKEVLLTYDSDEAGQRAALRGIPILRAAGITPRVVNLSPYKDPDEFIKAQGREAFEKRLDEAMNYFLFEVKVLEKQFDLSDPEGKTQFYREIAKKLLEFPEELERNNYMESISRLYQIQFEDLRKMVNRMALVGTAQTARPRTEIRSKKKEDREDASKTAQKLMLTWLTSYPSMFDTIEDYIDAEDFTTPLYHQAAVLVFAQHQEGEVSPAKLLNQFTDPQEQKEVASLFHATLHLESKEERKRALLETVCRLKRDSINWRSDHLQPADLAGLQKIVEERKRLEDLERGRVTLHISMD
ncbi:MAG TPA: DNA primase [Candidatus Blautia merdavium]|uniref:DNA primase n=1 Tax=Candidatus Blautia merdavium TaxID=2838494 RepID=A0A9D2T9Z5_9FIRM|nr:DNA primase [Candidatus Blautia merdavium]